MSKVLPFAIQDRPELNLRQGIKSSLNNWRQLLSSLYLFFLYVRDGGRDTYCKEIQEQGRTTLVISDSFAQWLTLNWSSLPSIDIRLVKSPLFLAQMEHIQVGLELFLKLAKVEFADSSLADASERTGGSRYCKKLHFSTNMKIYADAVSKHPKSEVTTFLDHWLSNTDDSLISEQVKEILVLFTEECQYKIRTGTGEVYFQQNGVYERLRNPADTVESSDAHEPVGPFRILKSFIKEGMHPYLIDSASGFKVKSDINTFSNYADLVNTSLMLLPKRTTVFQEVSAETPSEEPQAQLSSRQLIIYGAPGTGKSWRIKRDTKGCEVIRTTFHPDSDYSTFVGAYKPSMEVDAYDTVVTTGEKIAGGTISKKDGLVRQKHIVYSFRAQAFLEAYVEAWRKCAAFLSAQDDNARNAATQFLVIEEINRGNCAQIFGDIFQLLDREDDGYSSYAINADNDLSKFVADSFKGDAVKGIPALDLTGVDMGDRDITPNEIASGDKLLLPPNLYIWATMNTSDQSLFPIDSAFKRRWAWKYIPISNANKNYSIEVGSDKYDWWEFLDKANALVEGFTESEDKKLGYFFCKADKHGVISLEQFVGKVVFYLWNGVFKDTGFDDEVFDDGNGDKLYFKRFFDTKGNPNAAIVKKFMENLGVPVIGPQQSGAETETQPPAETTQPQPSQQ